MPQHTPGPWSFTEGTTLDGVAVWWIHQGDCSDPEYRVCKVPRTRIRKELEIANAQLIAAAPDLLAALEDCITDDNAGCIVRNDVAYMIRRFKAINEIARAAINKAKGIK